MALAVAGCDGGTISARPSPETIETAQSVSRGISLHPPISTTPQGDDDGKAPLALDTHVFGSGPTGVILAHMRPADQTSWFEFATRLAATGRYTVMTFDFRGFGASTGDKAFDRIDTDMDAVYAYMRATLGVRKVFLVGASMGGTAAIVVASRLPVAGFVSISSPAQFETYDATAAVASIGAPKLFVASEDDVPAERSLEELIAAAPEPKDHQIYDGDAHGTNIFAGPHGDELSRRIVDFLDSH